MSEASNILTTSSISTDCEEISLWKPEHGSRGTVVIGIRTLEELSEDVGRVLSSGVPRRNSRIDFVSYDLLHRVLAPNRMDVIRSMAGAGPLSMREVARRVGRDFKGVYTDIVALRRNAIIADTEDGKVIFPYDNIHVEFDISSAA